LQGGFALDAIDALAAQAAPVRIGLEEGEALALGDTKGSRIDFVQE
jgi:hypothetical protein